MHILESVRGLVIYLKALKVSMDGIFPNSMMSTTTNLNKYRVICLSICPKNDIMSFSKIG